MTNEANARARGVRMAGKVAVGLGLAIAGVVGAATAEANATPNADGNPPPNVGSAFATSTQIRGGNCGCSPCWGPPAPPRARRAARRRKTRRGAK